MAASMITTLDNGLKVASLQKFGTSCTVGVLIESGSRFEKSVEFAGRDEVNQALESVGGIMDCQTTRDVSIYATTVDATGVDTALKILSEAVHRPIIEEQQAAYRNNSLGLPKICPVENLGLITPQTLYTFMNGFYDPKRMVIAAVGIEHESLLEMVQRQFVEKKPIWIEDSSLVEPGKGRDESIAQYTGGLVKEQADLSELNLSAMPMPDLAHITLGLESCSPNDPDFVPFCVLNMLLGGGGSFSAGGPGKGMYSRLYLNSMLMMNLEQKPAEFEDIGRQVLSVGHRKPPQYYYDAIGAVTAEDMKRIADRMLLSKPAVAAYGEISKLPDLDTVQKVLLGEKNKKFKSFSSLFGKS
ncbi:MPPA-like protein [Mya arenaria]|uniref:MPPA-like protein n=1 Tax=Mya arenaria TaxID=6604 RepID=A0ABY7GBU6_MYAAR|nr:MPPA-like protein [Mya arenaria]